MTIPSFLKDRLHLPSTGHIPGSDLPSSTFLRRLPFPTNDENPRIPCRVHARIVFDDVGTPLKDVPTLQDSLSCLYNVLHGLRYVHMAGWVHRDVSATNILRVEDKHVPDSFTGKLMDFEYAKKIDSQSSYEIRTGTAHFMAVEVESQCYLFIPPAVVSSPSNPLSPQADILTLNVSASPSPPPFRMNVLHDVESAWWIVTWILFYHTVKALPTETIQRQLEHYRRAFPGKLGLASRYQFFTQYHLLKAAHSNLSETYRKQCEIFVSLAVFLCDRYRTAETPPFRLPLGHEELHQLYRGFFVAFEKAMSELEKLPPTELEPTVQLKRTADPDDPSTHQSRKRMKQAVMMTA
ncbi:hypothetical protein OG21DRAFT_1423387 [Imleria badia]|nr:hypothetical protein OG21DRAFT_1423387 [Imleria badia]